MADIPKHIQKRAMEIYTTSRCTLKEAFDKAIMEDQMKKEGFPQDIANLIGGCIFYFVDKRIFRGKDEN